MASRGASSAIDVGRRQFFDMYGVNLPRDTAEVDGFVRSIRAVIGEPDARAVAPASTPAAPASALGTSTSAGAQQPAGTAEAQQPAESAGTSAGATSPVPPSVPTPALPPSPSASSGAGAVDLAVLRDVLGGLPGLSDEELLRQQAEAYSRIQAAAAAAAAVPSTAPAIAAASSGGAAASSGAAAAPAAGPGESAAGAAGAGTTGGAQMCIVCLERPRDASFVHGGTSHIACCYECAMRQNRTQGTCPICRARVDMVIRNFQA